MSNKDVNKMFEQFTRGLSKNEKELIDADIKIRDNIALAMVKIREKAGVSQKELAKRLNKSQSWISRLENANYDHRIESIWKYLKALGTDVRFVVNLNTEEGRYRILVDEKRVDVQNEEEFRLKFKFKNLGDRTENAEEEDVSNTLETIAS